MCIKQREGVTDIMSTKVVAAGKESLESLVSIQKNITNPLRRLARVQLRGGLGVVDVENGGHTTHRRSS